MAYSGVYVSMTSHVTVKRYVQFLFFVFPSVIFLFFCIYFTHFSTFHIAGAIYASYTVYHYFVLEVFEYHLYIFTYAKRDPFRTFVVIVSDILIKDNG